MGKSASGKDSIYKKLMERSGNRFRTIVPYTTRPIRSGETEGVEYHFVSVPRFQEMDAEGKVIEFRCYHTVYGDWYYFTANDGQIDLSTFDYLLIMTPEGYASLKKHFGEDAVCPIYIYVESGLRLSRAVERERRQAQPKYAELCRRFLADEEDFSEEHLKEIGVCRYFENNDIEACTDEIYHAILKD